MNKFTFVIFLLFTSFTMNVNAQNLIPDSLFGTNATMKITTTHQEVSGQFLLQSDGKILFCGIDYDLTANDFHINMARFNQCGEMDTTFGTKGYVRHNFDFRSLAYAFALQADGKILCAGMQGNSNAASAQKSCIMRYNSDGSPDITFNGTGTHALYYPGSVVGEFHSVGILPGGRILGMGNFGQFNGPGAMRFLPGGSLDLSFGINGQANYQSTIVTSTGRVSGYLVKNGKMVFTAMGMTPSFSGHYYSVRLDSTGRIDSTYGTNGIYFDNVLPASANFLAVASAVDATERLLIATNIDATGIDVLRLKPSGVRDSTFGLNGYVHYSITGTTVKSMSVMPNGNILLKGEMAAGFGIPFGIMLLPNGSADAQFGANGFRTFDLNGNTGTHWLNDLLELPNGKWIVGATFQDFIFRKYSNKSNVPHIKRTGNYLYTKSGVSYQWFRNDTIITGAIDSLFLLTKTGTYTVRVTDGNGCTYLSDPAMVTNAGITDIESDVFNLFPNPATTELFIQTPNGFNISQIIITDIMGRVVQHQLINDKKEQYTIPLNGIPCGVYSVRIISDDKQKCASFIKN